MKRVLLVEDNREIAGMLFDYFECAGMQLDYADNGELGLKLAMDNAFDIIFARPHAAAHGWPNTVQQAARCG